MKSTVVGGLFALVLLTGAPARAQDEEPASEEAATVPSTAAAAEAYDRGSAFYLNGDYARAAQWFETAYRLAPAAPALVQALRAQTRTGHAIRAANLALRLRGLHGDDADARALADQVIAENGADFVRLEVDCEGCQLEIEGRLWSYPAAFLAPSTEHRVTVALDDAREQHTIRGAPGQRITLGAPRAGAAEDAPDGPPPGSGPSSDGLSPWVFGVGLAITAVSSGLLIWSGVDTLDGVDAYEANPTPEGFSDGQDRELRTNVLIGITAGLGLLTLVFALLTDWDGDPSPATTGGAWIGPDGGGGWVRGAF